MLLVDPTFDSAETVQTCAARSHGRVVWQERYSGIACVAYRNGKAIAGISGPWSDRYALIWWVPRFASPQLELFESLQAAKDSVTQAFGEERSNRHQSNRLFAFTRPDPTASRQSAWLTRLRSMLRPDRGTPNSTHSMRQRHGQEDIDLSGMHFSACR